VLTEYPVAISGGITIHCPNDGRYAFYNSPYPAHRLMTGIDLYPNTPFGGVATSPVDGEILQIRRVKAPQSQLFEDAGHDTLTLIKSKKESERIIKILHIDTFGEEGDTLRVGQNLGKLIRSGYFGFQTPPHIHLEVRPAKDPLRVRGGCPIESLLNLDKIKIIEKLNGIVIESKPNYAQILLEGINGPGVVADIGGAPGILDGGIPLYGWFGAHFPRHPISPIVRLLGKTIGTITNIYNRTCVINCTQFTFKVEDVSVNLFFLLKPHGRPIITLTPRTPGGIHLQESDEVTLRIEQL
jgi:hypothetical protein